MTAPEKKQKFITPIPDTTCPACGEPMPNIESDEPDLVPKDGCVFMHGFCKKFLKVVPDGLEPTDVNYLLKHMDDCPVCFRVWFNIGVMHG